MADDDEARAHEGDDGSQHGRQPAGLDRRGFLGALGATGLIGAAIGLGAADVIQRSSPSPAPTRTGTPSPSAPGILDAHAAHTAGQQPGMGAAQPAFAQVMAWDLADGTGLAGARALLGRLAPVLTALNTAGAQAPAAPATGLRPAGLEAMVGFGASLLATCGLSAARPPAMVDVPAFATDQLIDHYCGGDLVVQVGAEDPIALAGGVQDLLNAAGSAIRPRWSTRGFIRTQAALEPGVTPTPRNLMGQVDGTNNPEAASSLYESVVHVPATPATWMSGGSYMIIRRIRMLLADWFAKPQGERERIIGRDLTTGAPLTGKAEHDKVLLHATTDGQPTIAADAHIRLASPETTLGSRMFRRGFSYDDGFRPDGTRDAGLLFIAWQADPNRGFIPVQRALVDKNDALNDYIVHEGSALFAVPAWPNSDPYPGARLLEG